ncbi:hypothetical protein Ppa06_57750 [Planomonospora parontospora subsp. parontospora]|uniref:Uncharacterized protein n=2 Tax=Planomonospora parontospora TaxID=58119 RepID=A0AA37BMJ4_9ACTN|nr:hypothetical protein [Planomonospora parontospora]GGK90603.1 hypothetical protein GCM10010126_57560 [Planomonospora parontospora]GII11977.1 hypothetical protein Ppa06_57750 [Planomonospora parontospora subsp. parontospora]
MTIPLWLLVPLGFLALIGAVIALIVGLVLADTWLHVTRARRRVALAELADPTFNPDLDGLVIEPPHWKRNDA